LNSQRLANLVEITLRESSYTGSLPELQFKETLEQVVHECRSRILGVGAQQYTEGPQTQRFEVFSLPEMIAQRIEEVEDDINYAIMEIYKLKLWQDQVRLRGERWHEHPEKSLNFPDLVPGDLRSYFRQLSEAQE